MPLPPQRMQREIEACVKRNVLVLEKRFQLMLKKLEKITENYGAMGGQRPKCWRTTDGQDLWPCSHRHGFG